LNLVQPTDFEILGELADWKRNVAANLALELGRDRAYTNTRLPELKDYGLIERIGPSPNSGLYEITQKGEAVVEHRDEYNDSGVDFESLVQNREGVMLRVRFSI
jgi:predicted transcriptional regulator